MRTRRRSRNAWATRHRPFAPLAGRSGALIMSRCLAFLTRRSQLGIGDASALATDLLRDQKADNARRISAGGAC